MEMGVCVCVCVLGLCDRGGAHHPEFTSSVTATRFGGNLEGDGCVCVCFFFFLGGGMRGREWVKVKVRGVMLFFFQKKKGK
jgi:hypothetical protein